MTFHWTFRGGGGGGGGSGRRGRRAPYLLYALTPDNWTRYFNLLERELSLDQLLNLDTSCYWASEAMSHLMTNPWNVNLVIFQVP